jgi:SMC interacting uncharacterized protein involved in chromosome segregation
MKTYEELIKGRDALEKQIHKQKIRADQLPAGTTEKAVALAELASLRIQYAILQEEIIDYHTH